ncbi:hypothetical protein VA7868_01044 [Vibrio aerogenes CECT 7868]|uniref:Sel1 repeat family protein n=1 Tax=Vibrio aerogenes CECT 7868 TaxID=1216006 RepID=A0A1M5X9K2_9VIBR|nr:hypothetical protein [Vibrio aerogenes]SHH96204.1 hypothetical protein VA7868_01044 [Vibrio aerogenes CECT 7868]
MKYLRYMRLTGLCLLLVSATVSAIPDEQLIEQYNQIATSHSGDIRVVIHKLNDQIERDGADALSLIYLGSAQTLEARDAWLPWNKMKYAERGISTIAKGLGLLPGEAAETAQYPLRQGMPVPVLAKAIAAATYTSLPDMFNQFDRGYDLYLQLLHDHAFQALPLQQSGWVYRKAIEASIRNHDKPQAMAWVAQMQSAQPEAPIVHEVRMLVDKASWK